MKVIYDLGKINQRFPKPVVAVGVFDGLHLGHQYLIRRVVTKARKIKGTSIVLTFFPHPLHILSPKISLPFIVSLKHRLKLIERLGVDVCIVIRFTKKFSRILASDFIKKYFAEKIKPRFVFVGSDFRFGRGREGDISLLRKAGQRLGFEVCVVTFVKKMGSIISSTKIRKLIAKGQIDQASRLLGHRVSLVGKVVRGEGRGKKIGFPTANVDLDSRLVAPCGVYAVRVKMNNKIFFGMLNVGLRPSFNSAGGRRAEVHIFNFNKNIYGKEIEIDFLARIRPERKFSSKQDLIQQLCKDELKVRHLLQKHSS